MSEQISIKEEKLFNFLFAKIVELQTETTLLKSFISAVFEQRNSEANITSNELFDPVRKEFFDKIRKEHADTLISELKGISKDFDDMISSFLNKE